MNKTTKVQNRDFGVVGYTIPDLNNLYRTFQPNEIKELDYEELFKLYQTPGGAYILENYLIIFDKEMLESILGGVEPEYFYTSEDIIDLMVNGSLDEFEDCLNFAPKGVLDLIKQLSVSLPLNDVAKRDLILKKLNFNVANAIEISQVDGPVEQNEKPQRKAAKPGEKTNTPVRKVVKKTV